MNGILTGYRIYYQEVEGTRLGPLLEREPRIMKKNIDKAKLAGLRPHSKYRVTIRATTSAGEGMSYYTECDTNPQSDVPPSRPRFKYLVMNPEAGHARIKVTWMPQIDGQPGSHFYVQYKLVYADKLVLSRFAQFLLCRCRKNMETQFLRSDDELNEDSIVIRGLEPDFTYDFRVVAVDGRHETPSETLPIYTYSR